MMMIMMCCSLHLCACVRIHHGGKFDMFTRGRVGPSVIFRGIHFFVSFVGPDIMIG